MSTLPCNIATQIDNAPANCRVVMTGVKMSMNWLETEATRLYKRGRKGDRKRAARLRRQASEFFNCGAPGHDLRIN